MINSDEKCCHSFSGNQFLNEIPPSKYLRKWLRVGEGFSFDLISVQDLKDVPLNKWIVESYQETKMSDIRQSLRNYKLSRMKEWVS